MSKRILIGEKVLPVSTPPLNDYAVIVEDDTIVGIETIGTAEKRNPYAKRIVIENGILTAGLINLHTHLELTCMRGIIPEGINFFEWVSELIQRKKEFKKKGAYKEAVIIGIKEMIETGTTSVAEITSEGISPYILKSCGVRGKVFYEVIGLGPSANIYWLKKQKELKGFKDNSLLEKGLSPHSCYSVSYEILKKVSRYSSRHGIFLSSHLSETKEEGEFLRKGEGPFNEFLSDLGFKSPLPFQAPSPVVYFKDIGLLKKDFIVAHAVWVDERDIEIMKECSVSVAHCPRSNAYLNVGKAPIRMFIENGINIGIGTDSLASNSSLNMWDEMRTAYSLHREDGITAYEIFKMATQNGAKALGLDSRVGSIEIGKKADIIAIKVPEKIGNDLYGDILRETDRTLLTMVSGKVLHSVKKEWN